jgi:hypothetical protein
MLDTAGNGPDLSLLLGPHDLAVFLGMADWRTRTGRIQTSLFYVVRFRRGDAEWTQACRIVPGRRPGHLTIHIQRIADGDRCVELAAWLGDRLNERRQLEESTAGASAADLHAG